jgi:IS5 family transposase
MVVRRYQQRTLYEELSKQLIPDHMRMGREEWMDGVDQLLGDNQLVDVMQEGLERRWKNSKGRGRPGTPAEVVLRMFVLKHIKNWSYKELECQVRANLLYREFTRIGMESVPDESVMARIGKAVGPEVIEKLHQRQVELAREKKLVKGRKMRVDTTVVETNVHYPTDSNLMRDGVRVITRIVKKIQKVASGVVDEFRDRNRSVGRRVIEIAIASRERGERGKQRVADIYKKLIVTTKQVVKAAKGVEQSTREKVKRLRGQTREKAKKLVEELSAFIDLTGQVVKQTVARVIEGETHFRDKVLSLFEPHTEVIRKGKAAKPNEFGKLVKIQEAENQIITHYEVYDERPADQTLLVPAIKEHIERLGRPPTMLAADRGFSSRSNIKAAKELGVKNVAIGNSTGDRWFRQAQRWRVGCEGRISVLKRRHGLFRSRYRGMDGIRRWVGLGVIADNLISMASLLP